MKILHLEIENFGKLKGYTLDLRDGLNILHEKNGWGKSTLAVFIKAMFYGLPVTTKHSLDRNERKKYAPWQGGSYGGSLEFECEKGRFRVERYFGAKEAEDEFRLFDLSTNKPSAAFSRELGTELLGIDADGFERSTYLSQQGLDIQGENVSVTAKLTGLLEDVNDIGSFDVALEAIDRRRKYYEVKGDRGKVPELRQEIRTQKSDLENRRALLPSQDDEERALAGCKQQLEQAERESEKNRQALQIAEQNAHRMEERERMQQRLRETEERRQEVLRAFRNQQLPTDTELADARELLKNYRAAQITLESCRLSESESETLKRLDRIYPDDASAEDTLNTLQGRLRNLSDTEARLRALSEIPDSREQARFRNTGIPPQPLIDEAENKLRQAEQLQKQIHDIQNNPAPAPTRRRIPLLLPIAALIAAASAGYAGYILTDYRLPLFAACGVLVLIGILTLVLGGKHTDLSAVEAEQQLVASLKAEQEKLLSFVRGVLNRYGLLPASGDFRSALTELRLLAGRAQEDANRQAKQKAGAEALRREIENSRNAMSAGFRALGFQQVPADLHSALLQVRADLRQRSELIQKQRQAEQKRSESEAALHAQQDRLRAFLERLTVRESHQPEELLTQMERLAQEHATLLGEIGRQRKDLQQFTEQNRLEEPSGQPDVQTLQAQQNELKQHMDMLREEMTAHRRQLDRISAQTQDIPALEDQVRNLEEELQSAEENLNTLRRTQNLLTESKEALSTRYLDGMQQYFTHYRTLIDGPSAPPSQMDTSLKISVRDGGKSRSLESYSRGSRDILLFCARLALTRAMFPNGETPFLLLDDPFVNLDEAHFTAIRSLLDRLSSELQILYLVCHTGRI